MDSLEACDIVEVIIDDLRDRVGLGDAWDNMSEHVQNEIIMTWVQKIMEV